MRLNLGHFELSAWSLLILLALVGSLHSANATNESELGAVRKIEIVSLIGNKLTIRGPLVVEIPNETTTADISSWKLDEFIEQTASDKLKLKYSVAAPATVNRTDLAKLEDPSKIAAALRSTTSDVDTFVLVLASTPPFAMNEPNGTSGLVLERTRPLGIVSSSRPGIRAFYKIVIVDAHNGSVLATDDGVMPPLGPNIPSLPPTNSVPETDYSGSVSVLSPAQLNDLHLKFQDILQASLDETLFRLGLVAQAPEWPIYFTCERSNETKYTIHFDGHRACESGDELLKGSMRHTP